MTNTQSPADRFSVLSIRRGMTLGALYSSNRDDFALVLAAAASMFEPDRTYRERDVNDVLRGWLAGAGSMLDVDHVELRRWLVDNLLLERDGFGRAYTLGKPPQEVAAVVAALSGVDLAAMGEAARKSDAIAREARKRKWVDGRPADIQPARRG